MVKCKKVFTFEYGNAYNTVTSSCGCGHFVSSVFTSLHVIKKCKSLLLELLTIDLLPDSVLGFVMYVCL